MKVIPVVLLFVFSAHLFAQKTRVEPTLEQIAGGNNHALVVRIKDSDKKTVTGEWSALMKKNKAKVKINKEIFADDAIFPSISPTPVDIYAIVKQEANDVNFIVAIDVGGIFLNPENYPAQYSVAEKIIYDFAVELSKQSVQNSISAESKSMNSLEKKKKKLESNSLSRQNDNSNMLKKISENEKIIQQNSADIEKINTEINVILENIKVLEKKFKAID